MSDSSRRIAPACRASSRSRRTGCPSRTRPRAPSGFGPRGRRFRRPPAHRSPRRLGAEPQVVGRIPGVAVEPDEEIAGRPPMHAFRPCETQRAGFGRTVSSRPAPFAAASCKSATEPSVEPPSATSSSTSPGEVLRREVGDEALDVRRLVQHRSDDRDPLDPLVRWTVPFGRSADGITESSTRSQPACTEGSSRPATQPSGEPLLKAYRRLPAEKSRAVSSRAPRRPNLGRPWGGVLARHGEVEDRPDHLGELVYGRDLAGGDVDDGACDSVCARCEEIRIDDVRDICEIPGLLAVSVDETGFPCCDRSDEPRHDRCILRSRVLAWVRTR